jgi:dolichol-phosphate mannosyltransferase
MISVIVSAMNEEQSLPILYDRLAAVAARFIGQEFEFVFVNDGSTDQTANILADLRNRDKRICTVKFTRNFGGHAADMAGLNHCQGDAAILMAADLQDPPELIPQLVEKWKEGFNVVWAVRQKREGETLATRLCSRIYYALMNAMSDVSQPPTGADVLLLDRKVIDLLKQHQEKHTSYLMMVSWLGFPAAFIDYVKEARHAGVSKWSFRKRLKLAIDSMVSFSYTPIRLMSLAGVCVSFLGLCFAVHIIYNAFYGHPIEGWSSLMVVVLFLSGFQLLMLGMLGEYLWRTFDEARGRPRYVIEECAPSSLDDGLSDRVLVGNGTGKPRQLDTDVNLHALHSVDKGDA